MVEKGGGWRGKNDKSVKLGKDGRKEYNEAVVKSVNECQHETNFIWLLCHQCSPALSPVLCTIVRCPVANGFHNGIGRMEGY